MSASAGSAGLREQDAAALDRDARRAAEIHAPDRVRAPCRHGRTAEHAGGLVERDGTAVLGEPVRGGERLRLERRRVDGLVLEDARLHRRLAGDAEVDRHVGVARDGDLVPGRDADPVDGRAVDGVLADHLRRTRLERFAVAGAEAAVDLARVRMDAGHRDVELDDALEALALAQAARGVEPDLAHAADLAPLAGLEVDEDLRQIGLGDDVEHAAAARRGERALGDRRPRSRPGDGDDHGGRRGGREREPHVGAAAVHARVAQHRPPVARRPGVGRDAVLEHLSHRSTSVSCVCMFECAACSVADTVPRETPSASAIPA